MPLSVERVRRLEVWSTWECAGGTRIGIIADSTVLAAVENVSGADRLTFSVPINSHLIGELIEDRVIRLDEDGATFDEWKIVSVLGSTENSLAAFECAPFAPTDLLNAPIVEQILGDGTRIHDFDGVGLTVTQHFNEFILPVLTTAGMTWVSLGTVTPTNPVDLTYAWDSPLSALKRLAEASNSELQVRRVGTTAYEIDFITRIGATADTADVRSEKNLPGLRVDKTTLAQVTRVYPKGAALDGASGTMARATWEVFAVAGSIVTLVDAAGGDAPILFDDQLNGLYLRKPNGTLTLVTDSSASAQTVTVASATGLAADDIVQFRANSAGDDLTWLAIPGEPIKTGTLDRPDIPAANNLIENSATRDWPGSSSAPPPRWNSVGAPTIAKQTAAPFVQTGGSSIHVTAAGDGKGVVTDAVAIFPTEESPYGSGYADIWVVSGQVRVEVLISTPAGEVVSPPATKAATSSVSGQWESLGITGPGPLPTDTLFSLGATAVALRIVQHGTDPAEFYVDSAQFTETASQQPFVEGSGGTKLWQAANEMLRTNGGPLVTYEASLVDLARLDPATWSDARPTLGANARIKEPRLSVAITTRILEIERDYKIEGNTRILLSNKPDDISGTNARPKRPPRTKRGPRPPTGVIPDPLVPPGFDPCNGTTEGSFIFMLDGGGSDIPLGFVVDYQSLPTWELGHGAVFTSWGLASPDVGSIQLDVHEIFTQNWAYMLANPTFGSLVNYGGAHTYPYLSSETQREAAMDWHTDAKEVWDFDPVFPTRRKMFFVRVISNTGIKRAKLILKYIIRCTDPALD